MWCLKDMNNSVVALFEPNLIQCVDYADGFTTVSLSNGPVFRAAGDLRSVIFEMLRETRGVAEAIPAATLGEMARLVMEDRRKARRKANLKVAKNEGESK